jgi:hypothetical protein
MARRLKIPPPPAHEVRLSVSGHGEVRAMVQPGMTAFAVIEDGKPQIRVRKTTPEDIKDFERRAAERASKIGD